MYVRPGFDMITPAVKNLLLATIAVFLFQQLIAYNLNDVLIWFLPDGYHSSLRNASPGSITAFDLVFGLVPILVITKLYVWQLFTYMFLHGGFTHILFNMFALWIFGVELERTLGTREFVKYYFMTGVVAGLTTLMWNLGVGGQSTFFPTIGASGAIFGILIAYALFFPERHIYIYFLFPIKAKYFAILYGVLELMMLPNQDGISHISHLGGMVAGFFYLRHRYRHWGVGQNFFRDFFKKKDHF